MQNPEPQQLCKKLLQVALRIPLFIYEWFEQEHWGFARTGAKRICSGKVESQVSDPVQGSKWFAFSEGLTFLQLDLSSHEKSGLHLLSLKILIACGKELLRGVPCCILGARQEKV